MPRPPIPRQVWLLGWVSLLTDAASEAIYPLLPFFLTRVLGAGAVSLGLVEGVADATASLLRIVSGRLSDRRGRRGFVRAGYVLSGFVRPLIGVATAWPAVLAIRFADRIGKGIRGAPRDALIAAWAGPFDRGRLFGFHRAMDHWGAVAGPLAATAFLAVWPGAYRPLFLLAIVPGAAAAVLVWRVRDVDAPRAPSPGARHAAAGDGTPAPLPGAYRRLLVAVAVFTLGNSTDAFLLLRLTDALGGPLWVPALWSALHVVKAGLSTAGGTLSDRAGRRPVLMAGWIVYALVYAAFATTSSAAALVAWFLVYGVHYALTEGVEKALVADLAPPSSRGRAFGYFQAVQGFGALVASVLFGAIWTAAGAPAAFLTGAGLALVACAILAVNGRMERAGSA